LRILIFGAGGVGGYLGSKLAQVEDISLELVARKEHLEAIKKNGLKVIEKDQEQTFKLKAIDQNALEGVYDLILITTKTTDLDEAIKAILPHTSKHTIIISVANGVDNAKRIKEKIKDATVLDGCIYIISNIKEPGVIEKKGDVFKLCWGGEIKNLEQKEIIEKVKEIFDKAKLRHKFAQNIDLELWKKFLFISPMALLTSFYSLDMNQIYNLKQKELKEAMEEVLKVANALGINITKEDIHKNLLQASKIQKGAKTSMQLDIEQKKVFEIESLGGFVVKKAKELEIKTPVLSKIYQALSPAKENL